MSWITVGTSDRTHLNWLNKFFTSTLLLPYHMWKTNFTTQPIFEIKLNHYLSSLIFVAFMDLYLHSFIPQVICEIIYFEKFCILIGLEFLDISRTRFFSNILFLQKVKRLLTLLYWSKKAYISAYIFFSKTGICHFSYFITSNFMEKNDDPEILHSRQIEIRTKPNWLDTSASVGVQLVFASCRRYGLSVVVG